MLDAMPTSLAEDKTILAALDFSKPSDGCDPGRRFMALRCSLVAVLG